MQQAPVVSPDGYWMWNGTQWVPNTATAATAAVPPQLPAGVLKPAVSPDGFWMWNGAQWVPNPVANAAQPVKPYESARLRADLVSGLLAANIFGLAIFSIFDVVDVAYRTNPSQTLETLDGMTAILALIAFYGTYIAVVVVFLMWVHRIVRNMPALGSLDPRWSPTRAVIYSVIPFVALIHPLRSIRDAWRGSDQSQRWLDVVTRDRISVPVLFGWWWAAWLIGNFVSNTAGRMDSIAGDWIDLASNIILAAAAVLAIMVVRRLTARQEAKHQLIDSGGLD